MPQIAPYAYLNIGTDQDIYGQVVSQPDSITWLLPDLISQFNVSPSGFSLDPTGLFAVQTPAYVPIAADPTHWTAASTTNYAGTPQVTNANYASGQDAASGVPYLRQTGAAGGTGGAAAIFDTTFNTKHDYDEGFKLDIYRGAPTAAETKPLDLSAANDPNSQLFIEFSSGRLPGEPGLRIAVIRGLPVMLQWSADDGATWSTVDRMACDIETYLNSLNTRLLTIDVAPLSSFDYYANLPDSALYANPPPDTVAVVIGANDAVLAWRCPQAFLAEGAVRIYGTGGQWSCRCALRRYGLTASVSLPEQRRPRPFATAPVPRIVGFAPIADWGKLTATQTDVNAATAVLAVAASGANIDPLTNLAIRTVILSSACLEFPPSQYPAAAPDNVVSLSPTDWEVVSEFDQENFLLRTKATLTFADQDDSLAPGVGLPLGVRAATLVAGLQIVDDAGQTLLSDTGTTAITGLTHLDDLGVTTEYRDGLKYVRLTVSDRMRNVPVGYMLPMDGQCHYYLIRQLAYRMGITDAWMTQFPNCGRDSACPHYHLPQSQTPDPLFRFPPNTGCLDAMLAVRKVSGEPDFTTGLILPMYLYFDPLGYLQYFPAPAGVVSTWINPDSSLGIWPVAPALAYTIVPEFAADGQTPLLNEFLRAGPAASDVKLANIRPVIVLEGVTQQGQYVSASYTDPDLVDDPTQPGYVGLPIPYVHQSKLYNTQAAADSALQLAMVQELFPTVSSRFTAHYQAGLTALTVIAVQDYTTQGTGQPVNYFTTRVVSRADAFHGTEETTVEARLLGEAG